MLEILTEEPAVYGCSHFPTTSPMLDTVNLQFLLSWLVHSVLHCGFNLHFPFGYWVWTHFYIFIDHLISVKYLFKYLVHFTIGISAFFLFCENIYMFSTYKPFVIYKCCIYCYGGLPCHSENRLLISRTSKF